MKYIDATADMTPKSWEPWHMYDIGGIDKDTFLLMMKEVYADMMDVGMPGGHRDVASYEFRRCMEYCNGHGLQDIIDRVYKEYE